MSKFWLVSGAIFGFLSVALGAFGTHSLKELLSEYGKSIYEKAVIYQMFHSMALLATGLLQHLFRGTSFSIAGWGFIAGILLFSGSLYILAITGIKGFGVITLLGGIAFLLGWAWFMLAVTRAHS